MKYSFMNDSDSDSLMKSHNKFLYTSTSVVPVVYF